MDDFLNSLIPRKRITEAILDSCLKFFWIIFADTWPHTL